MLYLQKGKFQNVVRFIAGDWMTANQATLLGVVFIIATAFSLYAGLVVESLRFLLLFVPVFLIARLAMNTLDGLLSREKNTATVKGEILNETLDVMGDTICYGVLLFVPSISYKIVTLFLILIWAAEFYGVLGRGMPGGVRRHETYGGGKPDRGFLIGLGSVLLFIFPEFINYFSFYLAFICILVAITSIVRIKKIIFSAKGKKYESFTWIGK
jgi:CDP-diacylglycerol---glycerol-3-phosphate 3-phosphatidyltransferase